VEEILQVRIRKTGRGSRREALVKWTGYVRPTWEPLSSLENTAVLDIFEKSYRPATVNDGASIPGGEVM
jgi:hypothetical protein